MILMGINLADQPHESYSEELEELDVLVVGAGAAGIGCGVLLRQIGIARFGLIERDAIGASFLHWPAEMRFITPSFPSNAFGLLDLNAVALATSPAYTLQREHLCGQEYARYLQGVADYYQLPIHTGIEVQALQRDSERDGFLVETSEGWLFARYVIWATGEFQYPRLGGFEGAHLSTHSAQIASRDTLTGDDFLIIGGNESGIDLANFLVESGKRVTVLERHQTWDNNESDPSLTLSPYTQERLQRALLSQRLHLYANKDVTRVALVRNEYVVEVTSGECYFTSTPPLLATGFEGGLNQIANHFAWHEDGYAVLTDHDESTITPGLFVVGPQVRQGELIFCFIYKFRQRFAVVINEIAQRLNVNTEALEEYRVNGMWLEDLGCCADICAC
jgi:putative flavoprotein involved in K+ transport